MNLKPAVLIAAAAFALPGVAAAAPASPLRLADMPSGWTADSAASSQGSCGLSLGKPARSAFKDNGSVVDFVHSVAKAYPGLAKARQVMAYNLRAITHCRIAIDGADVRLGRMAFPRIGDQSFAFRIDVEKRIQGMSVSVSTGMVFFRHRNRVGSVTLGGLSLAPYQLEDFTRKALRRLG